MKYIVVHKENKVVEYRTIQDDVSIAIVESIPEIENREGFNAILSYNETDGVHWTYEKSPELEPQISDEEAVAIITDTLTTSEALNIITGGNE